jgi:hypothetical protein
MRAAGHSEKLISTLESTWGSCLRGQSAYNAHNLHISRKIPFVSHTTTYYMITSIGHHNMRLNTNET